MESKRLFVLGATGFIGGDVVREAVAQGWEVRALARSEEKARLLRALGAIPVLGDAREPRQWIDAVRGADVLVDLAQPALPGRIRRKDVEAISLERQAMTRELIACLREIAGDSRPLLVSVSGVDDLAPDRQGRVDASSPLRTPPKGFGHIGVPVRQLVEAAGMAATFVYLGTVYGPGKSFATTLFPRLAQGRMLLPCGARNQLPLIHVRDAARAIVHLASLGNDRLRGRSWILVDTACGAQLGELFDRAAAYMRVAPPARIPGWVLSILTGRILFETLTRDLRGEPSDLVATGFSFVHPTIREGIPATLSALGYSSDGRAELSVGRRRGSWGFRLLLVLTIGALVTVNASSLPLGVPYLRALAGGEPILDMRPGYTPHAAHQLLEALGSVGRSAYLQMLWTVDLLLPALFSLFLWSAIGRGAMRRWRWVGLGAGATDYLENAAITALLLAYPSRDEVLAWLASALTVSKFSLYFAALALATGGAWRARCTSRPASMGAP